MNHFFRIFALALLALVVPLQAAENHLSVDGVKTNNIQPSLLLKGAHDSAIVAFAFSKNAQVVATADQKGDIKLWGVAERKLLKTLQHPKIKTVRFIDNDTKLVVLDDRKISLYDLTTDKKIGNIEPVSDRESFTGLAVLNGKDAFITGIGKELRMYDSAGYLLKSKLLKTPIHEISVSGNDAFIAIQVSYGYDAINFLAADSFDLLHRIEYSTGLKSSDNIMGFAHFYAKKEDRYQQIALQNGVAKTVDAPGSSRYTRQQTLLEQADDLVVFASAADLLSIASVEGKFVTQSIKLADISRIDNVTHLVASPSQNHLLVIENNKVLRLYELNHFLMPQATPLIEQPVPLLSEPETTAVIETLVIDPVTPLVAEEAEVADVAVLSPKPNIEVVASQEQGFIPLSITFMIAGDNLSQIVGTYSNIDGKEKMVQGVPTMIKHTFSKVGQYKVMFAFKTADDQMIIKTLVIDAKKQTFEDFKKGY